VAIRPPRLFKANRFDRRPAGIGVVGNANILLLPEIEPGWILANLRQSGSFPGLPVILGQSGCRKPVPSGSRQIFGGVQCRRQG
jgi:hypothetical protein